MLYAHLDGVKNISIYLMMGQWKMLRLRKIAVTTPKESFQAPLLHYRFWTTSSRYIQLGIFERFKNPLWYTNLPKIENEKLHWLNVVQKKCRKISANSLTRDTLYWSHDVQATFAKNQSNHFHVSKMVKRPKNMKRSVVCKISHWNTANIKLQKSLDAP